MIRLRQEVEVEMRLRQELDEKVARMNQLLSTGQEALQQEKKTVDILRQQLMSPSTSAKVNNSTAEFLH